LRLVGLCFLKENGLNLADGGTTLDLKGKVTLLSFTAHWCGPCRESYPGINRLRARYGTDGFQVVLATQLYGFFKDERPLPAEAEIERDRTYFAEHGLDVPIAIGDKVDIKVENGKAVYLPAPNPNDAAYKVSGIPQIQLIDRQGRIRLIMIGYDEANEAKLASLVEGLVREK
jgi:thiol-disulfide isomerase/thioredoxin